MLTPSSAPFRRASSADDDQNDRDSRPPDVGGALADGLMLFAHGPLIAGEEAQVVGVWPKKWLPIGATYCESQPDVLPSRRVMMDVPRGTLIE